MKLDSFLVEKLKMSNYAAGQITQVVWREVLGHKNPKM
jgi:hypothetical protein